MQSGPVRVSLGMSKHLLWPAQRASAKATDIMEAARPSSCEYSARDGDGEAASGWVSRNVMYMQKQAESVSERVVIHTAQ
jgi:hypothetical protein